MSPPWKFAAHITPTCTGPWHRHSVKVMMETAQTADGFLKRAAGEFNDLRLAGSQLRYGQHLFMLLSVERSDIAEALRGTPLDPFYDHQVKQGTVDAIRSMW